jgi:hypothetical protein
LIVELLQATPRPWRPRKRRRGLKVFCGPVAELVVRSTATE